jgi:outer membrane protein OmpA-like peptidoglycan-associated protein
LYYSSDGSGGLGGYDIFKTLGDGKQWTGHQNLGLPLNSGADDIFYTIATDRQEGFFVSNRKGGNALKNRTCCDDIYYYKLLKYLLLTLSGNVSEMMDPSSNLANAVVEIFFIDKVTKEKVLVKRVSTDAGGNYSTSVEPGHDYFVVVKKDDYLGTSGEFTTQDVLANKNINVDLQLVRKPKLPIHIPNVHYLYDRSELEEGSKLPLDTTVLKLMVDNPEIIVEIMAHTDSKGTDAYNLKLSQKRAESVVKYLLSKGIAPGRLKAKGYGETMPVVPNSNPDGTDNPLGRAKNRRTDFKIIGVIDAEIIIDSEVPD